MKINKTTTELDKVSKARWKYTVELEKGNVDDAITSMYYCLGNLATGRLKNELFKELNDIISRYELKQRAKRERF